MRSSQRSPGRSPRSAPIHANHLIDSLTFLSHTQQRGLTMLRTLKVLLDDQAGFVVSAELVLVMTIGVLAMVVGLHSVAKGVTMELNDVANAFGAVNQDFAYNGLQKSGHARIGGSGYQDRQDDCDCTPIIQFQPSVKVDPSGGNSEST